MARNGPNWSSLPEDVLAIIAKRLWLHSLDEILRFRAVCRSFRSSSSIFYPRTSLIPRSSFRIYFSIDSTPGNGSNFIFTKSTIYAIQPLDRISGSSETSSTWMVRIEESNPGKVRINDPIGGYRFKNFKNLSNELPESLNLLDYRVKEIATSYRLELATLGRRKIISRLYRTEMCKVVPKFFWKVVVSEWVDGFAVMAIHSKTRKLIVWREGDERWTNIDTSVGSFRDIVCYNEKFYGLDNSGLIIAVDYKSFSITEVEKPLQDKDFRAWFLVKSSKDLFMIARNLSCSKIYKLAEEKCEWVPVMHEFEDRVWFAGNDWSFSFSAKELFGFEANCVYIHDEWVFRSRNYCPKMDDYPGIGTRICDLKNPYSSWPVYPPFSKIFWPPPTWVKKHSRSIRSPSHKSHLGS